MSILSNTHMRSKAALGRPWGAICAERGGCGGGGGEEGGGSRRRVRPPRPPMSPSGDKPVRLVAKPKWGPCSGSYDKTAGSLVRLEGRGIGDAVLCNWIVTPSVTPETFY